MDGNSNDNCGDEDDVVVDIVDGGGFVDVDALPYLYCINVDVGVVGVVAPAIKHIVFTLVSIVAFHTKVMNNHTIKKALR